MALDACTYSENEFKDFSLVKEQRALINDVTDPRLVQKSLIEYLKSKYNLTGDKEKKKAMQAMAIYLKIISLNIPFLKCCRLS